MAVSIEKEVVVLRQIIKCRVYEQRVQMLTKDAKRSLGGFAKEFNLNEEDALAIIRPIVEEIIDEMKINFKIE